MSDIDNPWRIFIENCMNGSNYFRSSEYMELLADLDRGYAAQAELERLRLRLTTAEALLEADTVGLPYWCECRDAFLAEKQP